MTPDPLGPDPADLAAYLTDLLPDLDVAAILRHGADVVPGELGELLAATADHIPTRKDAPQ